MKTFPIYETHSQVRCFNCAYDLEEVEPNEGEYPTGAYSKECPKCHLHTHYDIEPDPDEEYNARVDWEYDNWKDV